VIKDKDDIKFLECTLSGRAHYLVSGDKEVLKLSKFQDLKIISAKEFIEVLKI
jgi:predicted nucleic acid-binding protein